MRGILAALALIVSAPAFAQAGGAGVTYPPPDMATLMTRSEAEVTIARLESHQPIIMPDVTLAQTSLLALQPSGVREFAVTIPCQPGDRLIMTPAETSAPPAGFMLGDLRCSTAGGSGVAKLFVPQLIVGAAYSIVARVTAFR